MANLLTVGLGQAGVEQGAVVRRIGLCSAILAKVHTVQTLAKAAAIVLPDQLIK